MEVTIHELLEIIGEKEVALMTVRRQLAKTLEIVKIQQTKLNALASVPDQV